MSDFATGFKMVFLDEIGKAFIFKRWRPAIRSFFFKAGMPEVPYTLFGAIFWGYVLVMIPLLLFVVNPIIQKIGLENHYSFSLQIAILFGTSLIALGAVAFVLIIAIYFATDLIIFQRTEQMEGMLQDFLRMVAQNLKGGMPFERALWNSIKPEFGVLGDEIRLAAKKVITGSDVEDSLLEFSNKYDSPTIKRSFVLVIESLKGGGRVADIIERVADDLEETKELKAEMSATNLTYIIFISFVVIVVAPGLFALSQQFLAMLVGFTANLGNSASSTGAQLPFQISKPAIDRQTFQWFTYAALAIIGLFSAMIVAILRKGSVKGGIIFVPVFIIAAIANFMIMNTLASAVFSNIIPK